jgi:photosystem II stability/assembly factor-like uncharacterized protein
VAVVSRLSRSFRRLYVAVAMGIVLSTSGVVGAQPTQATASMPAPINLGYVHMVTASVGWGLTAHLVVKTTDGAHRWVGVKRLTGNRNGRIALAVLNAKDAWLAPAVRVTHNVGSARVWSTRNGGSSWVQSARISLSPEVSGEIGSLQFIDAAHGWLELLGSPGAGSIAHELLRTADGGRHWREAEASDKPHAMPGCSFAANVTFANAHDGWATGLCGAMPQAHVVYRTRDGGGRWFAKTLPVPACSGRSCRQSFFQSFPPAFKGRTGTLPALVNPPSGMVLYRTTNAGGSWSRTTLVKIPVSPVVGVPIYTASLDPRQVWALVGIPQYTAKRSSHPAVVRRQGGYSYRDVLYATSDSGRHWRIVSKRPGLARTPEIQFVSPKIGFATGGSQIFVKTTTDGGRTWHKIETILKQR